MPSNLQGLNIVHPALSQPESDSSDLLAGPTFPDLSAQLELWTNLAFDHDEAAAGLHNSEDVHFHNRSSNRGHEFDDLDEEDHSRPAIHDAHINVVTGTNIPTNVSQQQHGSSSHAPALLQQYGNTPLAQYIQNTVPHSADAIAGQPSNVDLISFLTSIGIDPFAISHLANNSQPAIRSNQLPSAPSIAQLLALQQSATSSGSSSPSFQHSTSLPPSAPPSPSFSVPSPAPTSSTADISSPSSDQIPATKRARSRKSSVSTTVTTDEDYGGSTHSRRESSSSPVTPAEDKRKRNTAASARFRLKKKEREAALEGRAKELEAKVAELERECEGLRRENGWLKGLVVGVTGAAQQQSQTGSVSAGVKRTREESLSHPMS